MADPRAKHAQKTLTSDPAGNGVPYPGGMGEANADDHDNETPNIATAPYMPKDEYNSQGQKYARGGCVTARGAETLAKLRKRHGSDV